METPSTFTNRSCIFARVLLLVSKWITLIELHNSMQSVLCSAKIKSAIFFAWNSFLTESPRWLISKGREAAAYRIVFNKKCDMEFEEKMQSKAKEAEQEVLNRYIDTHFQ